MMTHEKEGFIYQSTAPYMLAHYIDKVFSMEEQAERMGAAAKQHACVTHDPEANLRALLETYRAVSGQ
jgi:glycosyltransferase involved in cell wall biosynthesis